MFRNDGVTVLDTEGDSVDTFKTMIDIIYGNRDVLNGCQDWDLLVQIFKLADKYDVKVEIPNVCSQKMCANENDIQIKTPNFLQGLMIG